MNEQPLHNTSDPDFGVPAGLPRRLLASLYDWLLVIALMMALSVPLVAIRHAAIAPGTALYQIAMLLVAGTFFSGFWCHGGQTLGMRAWRLRLVASDGQPISLSRALLRFFYAGVAALPAGLGFCWALWDRQKRGWHDHWSRTHLVLVPKPTKKNHR